MKKAKYVVGVDVGGQTTKIGIVDTEGKILLQTVIRTDTYSLAQDYIETLADTIRDLLTSAGLEISDINGIGIGAPNGNYYTGRIDDAPNLAWAKGVCVEIAKVLSNLLDGITVTLTNDANAAALGEEKYGCAKDLKNFIMLTLGTGVGSGIIIDGKLLYGSDGFAGELGHTCADRSEHARQCNCGLKGCLETYCSAIGVARTTREFLARDNQPSLLREVPDEKISSYEVFKAAQQGDALALEIFKFTGEMLGRSAADFVKFSAPEAIVFFGGLARSKEFLHAHIVDAMNANLLSAWKGKIKVLYSTLPESDAAILGASALAW